MWDRFVEDWDNAKADVKPNESRMKSVHCLDDGRVYWFVADTGFEAAYKMRDYLNVANFDKYARLTLHEGRVWEIAHSGNTYACLA